MKYTKKINIAGREVFATNTDNDIYIDPNATKSESVGEVLEKRLFYLGESTYGQTITRGDTVLPVYRKYGIYIAYNESLEELKLTREETDSIKLVGEGELY